MGKELKDFRFQMMMTESEVVAIDDYRFANRISSRAEAIRQLVKEALAAREAKP